MILQRTIYDKANPVFAGPAEYFCKWGYVSVVQDCRGRFASEGVYYHMANEALDGYDTVEWTASQSWSNGQDRQLRDLDRFPGPERARDPEPSASLGDDPRGGAVQYLPLRSPP